MSENLEKTYNSILISGRDDATLTYTKHIKDKESGEMLPALLDKKQNKSDKITTAQIADGAVTNEKLANAAITAEKLTSELLALIKAGTGLPSDLIKTIQTVTAEMRTMKDDISANANDISLCEHDINDINETVEKLREAVSAISVSGGASTASAVTFDDAKAKLGAETAQQAIEAIVALRAAASGLAPLDASGEVPEENMPAMVTDVVFYHGKVSVVAEDIKAAEDNAASSVVAHQVAFNSNTKTFVSVRTCTVPSQTGHAHEETTYYASWDAFAGYWNDGEDSCSFKKAAAYGTVGNTGVAPTNGKIYVNLSDNTPYYWNEEVETFIALAATAQMQELLNKEIERAKAAEEALQEAVDEYNDAEADRKKAEEARVINEDARNYNEDFRKSAEEARKSAEEGRAITEEGRVAAEKARETAEHEREDEFNEAKANASKATAEAALAAIDAEKATTAAERVNAELDGNTFKVTNREGETKELDIEALVTQEEQVTVQLVSEVAVVAVEGIVLSVYINHGTAATKYTADAEGKVSFSVPIGAYYEVHFPDFADTEEISPIGYTATLPSREIVATYKEYAGDKETVTIEVKTHVDGVATALAGATLTCTINGEAAGTLTTDENGQAVLEVPIGKEYAVTLAEVQGYYVFGDRWTQTKHAHTTAHTLHFNLYQYKTGVHIMDNDGYEYTLEEWTAAGKTADDAALITVNTESLAENNAKVMIDPLQMSKRDFTNQQWCAENVAFTSIINGYTYDGEEQTAKVLDEAEEKGRNVPAFQKAVTYKKTVGGVEMTGYLGSVYQWIALWANRASVDEMLVALYGEDTKLLSDYTASKWTSDQSSAAYAYFFTSSAINYGKNNYFAVVPFYAY